MREKKKNPPTEEQRAILENKKKRLIVSASAGSGKTFVVIERLKYLICHEKIPVSRLLVLTFTKAAANEMKTRLFKAILEQKATPFLIEQLDDISISDISTIDSFCEKIIKRNINKLDLDENFRILDEKESKNLKFKAFNRVFDSLAATDSENFNEIYFSFKRSKDQIKECMLILMDYFDSQDGGDELIDSMIENYEKFLNDSLVYLNSKLKASQFKAKEILKGVANDLPKAYQDFKDNLQSVADIMLVQDFYENCKKINFCTLLKTPTNKIDDKWQRERLVRAKDLLKELFEITEKFNDITEEKIEAIKQGRLVKGLLQMLKEYKTEYTKLKKQCDGLDFADLEKYVKVLLKDSEVLCDLQKNYDYIFIDEYQDTNALQESIIKPISGRGRFVAVGDPKQGIYGFRNASMEIMQKDISDFDKDENSDALFLTGNFRSDDRLLSFVNNIFNKLMTLDSVGIDYEKTSVLKGKVDFKKASLPSVAVDIALADKEKQEPCVKVYSVKEDQVKREFEHQREVALLAKRVEEILQSQIYDAKAECFRQVRESDIAILFRSRSDVMEESVRYLQEKGFSVQADIKQTLLEDGQVQVIVSLLKLTLNFKDDISLVSVMNSWFGGFTLDELADIRLKYDRALPFYEIILQECSEKVNNFIQLLQEFKFLCQTLGLSKALTKLFIDKDYFLYINSLADKNTKHYHIQELLKLISAGQYEYNLAGLLNYLENIDTKSGVALAEANAIIITTIHATKGLEYPIVILAGCGESLGRVYNKPYAISSKFGLGSYMFDYEDNTRSMSPIFLANKLYRKRREFVDELMIFYVALTRAQNHLFLLGSCSEKELTKKQDLFSCSSYFDLLFFSMSDNFCGQLLEQEEIKTENYQYRLVSDVDEVSPLNLKQSSFNDKLSQNLEDIKKYIDFQYKNKEFCTLSYKNSVSGILKLEEDMPESFAQSGSRNSTREQAILRGNAYHEALKLVDCAKIDSFEALLRGKDKLKESMTEGYFDLLDLGILYQDIIRIKELLGGRIPVKEQQFIMEEKLCDVLDGVESEEKVIVQGVIDLFALGEKNILIDYKFTSVQDKNILLSRYKKQLKLYADAVEKVFNVKLDEIYLLSLANGEIIRYR